MTQTQFPLPGTAQTTTTQPANRLSWPALALLLLFWTAAPASAQERALEFDPAKLTAHQAKFQATETALAITTAPSQGYPGLTIPSPNGSWNLSACTYLALDVKNTGPNPLTLSCRVDNPGADGTKNCNTNNLTLQPGQTGLLKVVFQRKATGKEQLFGMRGYPPGRNTKEPAIDPAKVNQLLLFVTHPKEAHAFEVANLRVGGTYVAPRPDLQGTSFLPFIDTFGQYMHADWPGKVLSLEQLKARIAEEDKDLAQHPGPADWDQYGGFKAGPKLKATGFFRAEKYNGKWWLVDPEGHLFFSHGIDCVRMADATPIEERQTWFADFPGDQPELAEFIVPSSFALKGHYAGRRVKCYSFVQANLKRKYGQPWPTLSAERAHQRLRSWGMNTVANWSDPNVQRLRKTPYTATVGFQSRLLEGSQGYWGKFRDVYDPSFQRAVRDRMAQQAGRAAGDPWCLGFFVDNELSWGDELSLAIATLTSPADQPAKKVFLDDLKAKYTTIEKLNAAWGTQHASWDALLSSQQAPDKSKAAADLGAFYTKTAEIYFRTVRDAVKQAAPNQLYLGCRFAWANPRAVAAAAKSCDVLSYNLYRRSVADFKLPADADVPLIIGEFHFGALDRGMFHTGLVRTESQADRAKTYQDYVQGALRHPQFVGTHWFQYQDQPTTGRVYDEENYQIGFVDIADTPYAETIQASRQVGYNLYRYRLAQ